MVGIWSKNLTLQQYSWPLCERPNKSRVQGHATREYPSTNPILLAYSIWQLGATPERSFCFFQPLEKAKIHAHYIVQMKNRTEPNRFAYYFSTNRTEPNREPEINQFLENETEPNRPHHVSELLQKTGSMCGQIDGPGDEAYKRLSLRNIDKSNHMVFSRAI